MLFIIKQNKYTDNRGNLRVTFNNRILKNKNFVYEYCTTSKAKALRGFHFQYKYQQAKYICVVKGKILDCVIDLRKNSKTFGKHHKVILSDKNCKSFFIPKGFAHGFLSLEKDTIVLYGCSNYRDKNSEVSIKWNDKDLGVNWGIKNPILSKKDKNAPSFNIAKRKIK